MAKSIQYSHGQLVVPMLLLLLEAAATASEDGMQQDAMVMTLVGCDGKCGDMSIPFPFGMEKPGCFLPGFEVICNTSFTPPRAFLAYNRTSFRPPHQRLRRTTYHARSTIHEWPGMGPVELSGISVADSEVRAYSRVASYCTINSTDRIIKVPFTSLGLGDKRDPFLLSPTRNVLVGVGWSVEPKLVTSLQALMNITGDYQYTASCRSDLMGGLHLATNGSCSGRGCCHKDLPESPPLREFGVVFKFEGSTMWNTTSPCSYGMVVEKSWYNFSTPDLDAYQALPSRFVPMDVAPMVLDFAIRNLASCPPPHDLQPDYACVSAHSSCANATNGQGYVCKCADHYHGNPYIADGCKDINECNLPHLYRCSTDGICENRDEGYDCPCKPGMKGDGKAGTCSENFPLAAKVIVGAIAGLLVMAFMSSIIIVRKEKRKTSEFYQKNGGPTLEKAKIIKLFKKEDLKPFLKGSNLIGKGSFGEVYKGIVNDVLVAIKKPISGNVLENEQFANEVIIQSQVIHKNIVRLIGCCLEVDAPMLVYEFLSKGSLHDILHGVDSKEPLNLDVRLSIAAESSHGLAYMHSQTHTKILHGDVKPANILLDDNFVPKISDFGISRLIARDKQHTGSVIGDMTYMDPVYLQEGLLTEKSDVYSFGIVILELISRKKATHSDNNSLVKNFLENHKKGKKLLGLFDKEIVVREDLELLDSLARIAMECLNLDVDRRPSMTDVAERLLILNRTRKL